MKTWYILFTNYENSLATMKRLVKSHLPKGCGAYIPTMVTGNKYQKKRLYNKPMYPFYLFVCCTSETQLDILLKKMSSMNISGYFLKNSDGSYATLSLDQIRKLETSFSKEPTQEEINYLPGDTVRVVSGPMSGVSGTVTSVINDKVLISFETKKGKYIELPILVSDLYKEGFIKPKALAFGCKKP